MKNRVVSFLRVKASELLANPDNVRFHPPEQMAQMTALLEEIGMADAIIVRERPEGYQVLDGHMRRQLLADEIVPVIRRFGIIKPIICKQDGLIVAGHQRTKALRANGVTHAPVYVLPGDRAQHSSLFIGAKSMR